MLHSTLIKYTFGSFHPRFSPPKYTFWSLAPYGECGLSNTEIKKKMICKPFKGILYEKK